MIRSILLKNKIVLTLTSLIAVLLNAYLFELPVIGFIAMIRLFLGISQLVGPFLLPNNKLVHQISVGFMSLVALLSIAGSALYYIGPVHKITFVALIVVITVGSLILNFASKNTSITADQTPISKTTWLSLTLGVIAVISWWSAISGIIVQESIKTPWDAVNPISVLAIGTTILLLGISLNTKQANQISVPLLALTFFSSITLAAIIFPLGFGFDPFIHRTTVAHIAEFGTIAPKPFYYIGQYVLELTAVHVFALPLNAVDTFLVPALASLFVVISGTIGYSISLSNKPLTPLLALFLLPLSIFTITTPQSLAYIYTIALVFLSLPVLTEKENSPSKYLLTLFTLAALITHPLAGIPAGIYLILVLASTFKGPHPSINIVLTSIIAILGSIALPVVFVMQASSANLGINFNLTNLFDFSRLDLSLRLLNRFSTVFDGIYLFIDNMLWILIILGILGAIISIKKGAPKASLLPILCALIWFLNFWILSTTLEFNFLIEYERANYSARLLTLTMIFLVPHIGFFILGTLEELKNKPSILTATFLVLFTLMSTAGVYGAYPRDDNYAKSSGFNVSQNDLDAVWEINKRGADKDYIVLANQAVSAAALESFGFKKYYKNDIFYYPIPTGDKLYQLFLSAMEYPAQNTMLEAMDLAGVDTAFLVVNDYWWQAERVSEQAKNTASEWFSVGNGAVHVFIFER